MLGGGKQMGERIMAGPAIAWFRDALWIVYGALDGALVVRAVDVRHSGQTLWRRPVGLTAGWTVSVAVWGSRLHVLCGEVDTGYQVTSTYDGLNFSTPVALPLGGGFTGIGGMAVNAGGLSILWAENAGGQAHLLQSTNGTQFYDTVLPFNARPYPALAATDPQGTELLIAYGTRDGGPHSFNLLAVDAHDPAVVLRSTSVATPHFAVSTSLCAAPYRNQPGFHVVAQESDGGLTRAFQARSGTADLATIGGREVGRHAVDLSLAFDGIHAWVAWRDDVDELWVGPYMSTFELPEELLARLGERCDPGDCPVDPRLICTATEAFEWQWKSPVIANAWRGDLIMTPSDGTGTIGTLLGQLDPPQHYDHMGIMVRDHDLVRHATMAHDRIQKRDPGRFMTGNFYGDPAPVNGIVPHALTYGWPGTLTQSIDDAFYTGFNTVNPATGRPYNAQGDFFALNPTVARLPRPPQNAPEADQEAWRRQQCFADPEYPTDEPYAIHNFPNKPAYLVASDTLLDAVVVKPNPAMEANDPRIRQTLQRIADAAEQIHGHYRFYSYTEARIAFDPAQFGPPAGATIWDGKPAGAAWCAGTRPVVCSSFVWSAVQLANAQRPLITVEGEATEDADEVLSTPPVDGLYRYLTDERERAGQALYSLLVEKIEREVYLALQQAEHENRLVIDLGTIGVAGLLALLAGPTTAAAVALGVTPGTITDLKMFFEDMPDNVATQLCNTFAKDRADEKDEELWHSPGEGLAVSPDDIMKFWDAPDPASNQEWWHGLYGETETALLTTGRWEPVRMHVFDRSPGPAYVWGRVTYQGESLLGARVRYGCQTTMTSLRSDEGPRYQLDLSAGQYEVVATAYWPTTQEMLTGRRLVTVDPGDQDGPIDIELEDPPQWRRLIRVTGKIDVVRRVLIGSDDWAHSAINDHATLIKAPQAFEPPPPPEATFAEWKPVCISDFAQRFNVRVDFTVTLHDDLSIAVVARSALCEHYYDHKRPPNGDEVVTASQIGPVTIVAGGSHTFTFDHNSGNFPPDRGHVECTLANMRAPA